MYDLVIVESPAKAKTIGKYLGDGYRIEATMGHLRDLPKSTIGVDPDHDFEIDYQPIKGKEATIEALRKASKNSGIVYLATDPDREGEAISWHLKELLGLDDARARRVTFNEITQKVVIDSINAPRDIDYDLVDAQQARRVLDRLVGYKISPLLWKRIKSGLSAGRVQSVATRMVVDRENEIRAFTPEEYWSIEIDVNRVSDPGGDTFSASYFAPEGAKKVILANIEEVDAVVSDLKKSTLSVVRVKHSEKKRQPYPPFTTSTLQQDASRRLGMGAKRVMANAQALYEGVDVHGLGHTGLITYMRTDSLRLSDEAVDAARALISERYGERFLPKTRRVFKSKAQAQDAHEAIRPSIPSLTPERVKSNLSSDQYRLYKLIWERFIACQMENAIYDTLTIDVRALGGTTPQIFRANHTTVQFQGFTAIYEESREDENEDKKTVSLPDLREGEDLKLSDTKPAQHFTLPPPRFSEATLIKALEEQGIGRPSTYAPTVSTIVDREYVVKESNKLRPTPLGEVVNGLMLDKFANIVDPEFTARMERELDQIGEGKKQWKAMLSEFYGTFSHDLEEAANDPGGRIKIPDEPSDVTCDLCGRKMVKKTGRFGRFLACPGYPDCKNTKPLAEETPGICPKCGNTILKKKSRNGYTFYGCAHYPACDFVTWDVPQKDPCDVCGHTLFKTGGRGVKKTFCINPECANFLPEEQRSYRKKKDENGEAEAEKKPTKKAAAPKKAATTKNPAAKKPAAKKTTAKKSAPKKAPAVKT
ncbi:DNA topoisomerase I [Clostridia bacterium]|nr:DNA topoisomerase I [Clostridia bacterium]